MASRGSSDSDYSNGGGGYSRGRHGGRGVSNKVETLASTLQDTNKNLRAMDKMLGEYKDLGDQQNVKMDKLHDDYLRTTSRLRDERDRHSTHDSGRPLRTSDLDEDHEPRRRRRMPTSPLRDHEPRSTSDREYQTYDDNPHSHRNVRGQGGAVRFFDDMDTHQVHQSLRDVSSGNLRIEHDLHDEIGRRNRWETESKKTFHELRDAMKKPDQTMSSVDKRLQSIQDELKNERVLLKKKHDEVGKISTELKKALVTQQGAPLDAMSEENHMLKTRLTQSESQRGMIDELKRQLEQSHGEKQQLRSQIEEQEADVRERRHRLAYEEREREQLQHERERLEKEVKELRAQLSKSASVVGDYGELRRHLDKSEKQRLQLSDHIEVLNKDTEKREKQTAKVITQLQEMTDKYQDTEQQRANLLSQLEDTQRKLKTTSKDSGDLSTELRETQKQLQDSEGRKEEIKARAQETVRQWKVKCKKLERDLDRYKHSTEQATERCEQLIKELEITKAHNSTAGQQLDHIKREFSELLAIRAQQDEQVRLKDIEVNELKSFKMDMEKDLRDCKMVIERLEYELHAAKEKAGSVLEEKMKLEDQISAMENGQVIAHGQIQQFQREMREVGAVKVELSSQLADLANQRQELKSALSESRQAELAAREEIEKLLKRHKEEKDFYMARMEGMKVELDGLKTHESLRVQDIVRRYKKDKAEYEAELQALRIQFEEEKSSVKLYKKQQDKLNEEIDRLNKALVEREEESSQLQQQYHHVREEFITKSQLTEDDLSRAKDVELELLDSREALRKKDNDYENILHSLAAHVDSVIEVAAIDSVETYKALSMTKAIAADPQKCVAEMKSKLDWLKAEIREGREKEQRLRCNIKDAVINSEKDRQFLITEIERQNEVLDQLSGSHSKLESSDKVERDVDEENFKFQPGVDESDEENQYSPSVDRPTSGSLNNSIVQETQKEREKIHERFAKLQETMSSLKQELTDTRVFNQLVMSRESSSSGLQRTPNGKNKRVSFGSPDRLGYKSPISRSPGNNHHRNQRTPPPLALTDEEFEDRFLPKDTLSFDNFDLES